MRRGYTEAGFKVDNLGNIDLSVGICLRDAELQRCFEHEDCSEDLLCVAGHCGERTYFEAIRNIPLVAACDQDSGMDHLCQVLSKREHIYYKLPIHPQDLLIGDACCYDLSNPGSGQIGYKCCDHESRVIAPSSLISDQEISQVQSHHGQIL